MRAGWTKLRGWGIKPAVLAAYLAVVTLFVGAFAQFYIPGKGFTFLIAFGSTQQQTAIPDLKGLDYYVEPDAGGYDAQYYVQIAMHPTLRDPHLGRAVDNLAYRGRRILLGWLAYAMGLGQPQAILNAFVLQNAISWLVLAGVLLWWFPPNGWSNLLRWGGVLFSFGICVSLRNSLVDGPSLMLIALGVMLLERGRTGWATLVLAAGGLAKETNLLGAASLLRPDDVRALRRWPILIGRGLLVLLPLAVWLVYIERSVGPAANLGVRNFDWPLLAYGRKWIEVWQGMKDPFNWRAGVLNCGPFLSLLMLVALTVQVLFLLLRPAPKAAWWRVGLSFAVLFFFLGDAVWEGYPGAASRVLLPLQLAFNVLVPTGWRWWPVLLLGNLTLLNAPASLQRPSGSGYELAGDEALQVSAEGARLLVRFDRQWYEAERNRDSYWRWCSGSSAVTVVNPHAFPIEADMSFTLLSPGPRHLRVVDGNGGVLWQGNLKAQELRVHVEAVRLNPGDNRLSFVTDVPVDRAYLDPRSLAFSLKNWVLHLRPAPQDGVVVTGPASLLRAGAEPGLQAKFPRGWYAAERGRNAYWRWTEGPAELVLVNRQESPVRVRLGFVLNGISKRIATLQNESGELLWTGEISSKHSDVVGLPDLILAPGENRFKLSSNLPASGADEDSRLLDLCVKNLRIEVSR